MSLYVELPSALWSDMSFVCRTAVSFMERHVISMWNCRQLYGVTCPLYVELPSALWSDMSFVCGTAVSFME